MSDKLLEKKLSLKERLDQAMLKASTNFICQFQDKMEKGELVRPEDVCYEIMVDREERAADRLAAAAKIMSHMYVKPAIQKELIVKEEESISAEDRDLMNQRVAELLEKAK